MWPLFWPSPELVTLALETTGSYLELPTRAPRDSDQSLAQFDSPESAKPQNTEVLEEPNYTRLVERDDVLSETRLSVVADSGMVRLTDLGWEHGSVSRQNYSIRDGDPNSAQINLHWTMRFRRPDADLDVRTETHSSLISTPTEFHFTAEMEVFEYDKKTYSKNWAKSFERKFN